MERVVQIIIPAFGLLGLQARPGNEGALVRESAVLLKYLPKKGLTLF
mgnify:CR=1 FL=1